MRRQMRNLTGTKLSLDVITETLAKMGYALDEKNTTQDEYWYKNGAYHLKITPKKTRTTLSLHIDKIFNNVHYGTITDGPKLEKEIKKVKKSLVNRLY